MNHEELSKIHVRVRFYDESSKNAVTWNLLFEFVYFEQKGRTAEANLVRKLNMH